MRSLFAGLGAAWFIYNAFTFIPNGAYLNPGAAGGIDGDPGAVAVTWAARQLFIGHPTAAEGAHHRRPGCSPAPNPLT